MLSHDSYFYWPEAARCQTAVRANTTCSTVNNRRLKLIQRVNLDHCDAGSVVRTAENWRVTAPAADNRVTIATRNQIKEAPANADQRSLGAKAYEYLGYAYTALASANAGISQRKPGNYDKRARDVQESVHVFDDLRTRNLVNPADAEWPGASLEKSPSPMPLWEINLVYRR